jgi:hypothetical protein
VITIPVFSSEDGKAMMYPIMGVFGRPTGWRWEGPRDSVVMARTEDWELLVKACPVREFPVSAVYVYDKINDCWLVSVQRLDADQLPGRLPLEET